MSVKLDIYNAVEAAIKKNVTEIREFGLWNSQFDNEKIETAFAYPVVFLEFGSMPWAFTKQPTSKRGSSGNISKEQTAPDSVLVIHIGFSQLQDVSISFPKIDPIIEKVYFALQGLNDTSDVPTFGPLKRIDERQDTNHGRVIDWQMDFQVLMAQCGELDTSFQEIDADDLTLDITVDLDIDSNTVGTIRTDVKI